MNLTENLCSHYIIQKRTEQLKDKLFTDNFNHYSFVTHAVKLTVKNLFPRSEIKLSVSNGNNDFTSHYLTFDMRIAVVFISVMVII